MMTASPTRARRLAPWIVLAAVVVVVGIVVGIVALTRPSGVAGGPASTAAPSSSAPSPTLTESASPSESTEPSPSDTAKSSAPASTRSPIAPTSSAPIPTATTKSPVPIDKTTKINKTLTAEVSRLEAVKGKASGPGEVAGPSIRATVVVANDSGRKIDLSNTVVNLYYGEDKRPSSLLSGPGARSLPTSVKAGGKATGVYVFNVPKNSRETILITVDYSVKTPVVAFQGKGPT